MEQPSIREVDAMTIVGVGENFISALAPDANNFEVIPGIWHALMQRIGEIEERDGLTTYGVCIPLSVEEAGRDGACRYIAGVPVRRVGVIPDGMEAREIGATTYAVFTHRGAVDGIGGTLEGIYGEWLPASGYRRASAPDLEIYDERFTNDEQSEMEIWVPVERAA